MQAEGESTEPLFRILFWWYGYEEFSEQWLQISFYFTSL